MVPVHVVLNGPVVTQQFALRAFISCSISFHLFVFCPCFGILCVDDGSSALSLFSLRGALGLLLVLLVDPS